MLTLVLSLRCSDKLAWRVFPMFFAIALNCFYAQLVRRLCNTPRTQVLNVQRRLPNEERVIADHMVWYEPKPRSVPELS